MNEKMTVELLRVTYNSLVKKRNPRLNGFYDVFGSSNRGKRVKKSFENLARKLILKKIDPVKYVKTMCIYGQYKNTDMPWPSFLCSKKALERFDWLYNKELKNYRNEVDMLKNLPVGMITDRENILEQIKKDHNYYWFMNSKASELDKRKAEYLFLTELAMDTAISPWYLALSDRFVEGPGFELLPLKNRKLIKGCRTYYAHNPRLKAKALKVFLSPEKV